MLKSPNSREDASKNSTNLLNEVAIESTGINLHESAVDQIQQSSKSHSHKLADPSNSFRDSFVTEMSKKTLDKTDTMISRVPDDKQSESEKGEEEKEQ